MEEFPRLTAREGQVLKLLLQGKSNKRIAWELSISERTVEFHLKNLYAKFGVCSRIELILMLGKTPGWLEAEKLGKSTVARSLKIADNRIAPAERISGAMQFFSQESAMKALLSKHVLIGLVTALCTGFTWMLALLLTQNGFPTEVREWSLWLLLVWAISGLTVGLIGKRSGSTLLRVLISTGFGVGFSPLTIIPLMLYVVLPIGRIAESLGLIDAATMPATVAVKLSGATMIALWLLSACAIGIPSLFLTFKKRETTTVPTNVEQSV
jgi:DNA-binding CsgD family transcriptional regulator